MKVTTKLKSVSKLRWTWLCEMLGIDNPYHPSCCYVGSMHDFGNCYCLFSASQENVSEFYCTSRVVILITIYRAAWTRIFLSAV